MIDSSSVEVKAADIVVDEEERAKALRLFETTLKWLQSAFARMHYSVPPEVLHLLPLVCIVNKPDTFLQLRKFKKNNFG